MSMAVVKLVNEYVFSYPSSLDEQHCSHAQLIMNHVHNVVSIICLASVQQLVSSVQKAYVSAT